MERKDLNYIVISCTTRNEAIACCELADILGWKWCSGRSYTEQDLWEMYEEKTCYSFFGGEYCNLEYYESMGYTVKSSEWFLDNFSIKENSSKLEDLYSMADSATKELLKTKFTKEELGILPNTWEEFEYKVVTNFVDLESLGTEGFELCEIDKSDNTTKYIFRKEKL